MAIITFRGNSEKDTGNSASAIAVATYMSIKHNMKILLLTTGYKDDIAKLSYWSDNKKTLQKLNQKKQGATIQSGIEGLNLMISSGKIEPRIVRDYTNVVLTGRFDVLLGYEGNKIDESDEEKQYLEIQENYLKVLQVASQYYDMIIVDLDKKLKEEVQNQIIQASDIIVTTTSQKMKDMQELIENIEKDERLNDLNTIIVLGRYDDGLKYNIKNLGRSIFKKNKNIFTLPYNRKFYESMQEGMVVDLFLNLLRLKNIKDPNYIFLQEVGKITESIMQKWEVIKTRKFR